MKACFWGIRANSLFPILLQNAQTNDRQKAQKFPLGCIVIMYFFTSNVHEIFHLEVDSWKPDYLIISNLVKVKKLYCFMFPQNPVL